MHPCLKRPSLLLPFILLGSLNYAAICAAAPYQAEDYAAAFDTTTGNTGNVYRTGNVDIQATTDTGGGFNVGWIEPTEWLSFNNLVIPATGDYLISARVASASGGTLSLDLNGGSIPLGALAITGTGGWQTWKTFSKVVKINAGTYSLGVYATTGGWNLNWVDVVSCQQTDCGHAIPGRVEAERYNSFLDTTAGNTGGQLRTDNVDIELTTDSGGGYNVGWIDAGEYLRYRVNVSMKGRYKMTARVASPNSGTYFKLKLNGSDLGSRINVPTTGNWQTWQNVSVEVSLDQGAHELEAYFETGNFNLNYVDFEYLGPNDNSSSSSSSSSSSAGTLKVMTYNVRTTPAGDVGERFWDNRKAELITAIKTQLPQVIGFQEATTEQHDYIKGSLGGNWSSSPQRQIIYRNDAFDLVQGGIIELVADVWGRRTSEWIKLRRKSDSREFLFLNNHWGVDGNSQQGSANILRDTLPSLNQSWSLPTILLGDLNAAPGSGPINTLMNQTQLISLFTGNTFNGWNPTPNVQLDYIFASKFTLSGCNLITYREGTTPPSDHYPIFCEVKFL
ncbi:MULTISPECIES: carbohydrate-binding protein [Cellvibrio]|uniref:Endonuclease/exonuclease/phosphatase family metal-dependent hydrolase n=1 Tax=Cellvibrio fibrivorans TaxID=126350 RepID=A0ABU1V2L8_9GAMM|nr:carbohydrate-binding protein [Cellvibrio fibrivorans]MDR7091676.1 endonuclease/exonuclease/phosphatase family metal-dependent hydrolase [Cellvibrio fibrivorans]